MASYTYFRDAHQLIPDVCKDRNHSATESIKMVWLRVARGTKNTQKHCKKCISHLWWKPFIHYNLHCSKTHVSCVFFFRRFLYWEYRTIDKFIKLYVTSKCNPMFSSRMQIIKHWWINSCLKSKKCSENVWDSVEF